MTAIASPHGDEDDSASRVVDRRASQHVRPCGKLHRRRRSAARRWQLTMRIYRSSVFREMEASGVAGLLVDIRDSREGARSALTDRHQRQDRTSRPSVQSVSRWDAMPRSSAHRRLPVVGVSLQAEWVLVCVSDMANATRTPSIRMSVARSTAPGVSDRSRANGSAG